MNPVYDFIVIGGGSAGYTAATAAARLGLRTALVDGGNEIGGLCILRGCMPSKALIESANRFMTLRRAEEFGLRAEKIAFSGEEIIGRKRRLVAAFADYRRKQIETGAFHFFRGLASFTGTHSIEVRREDGVDYLQGQAFLIATGSTVSRVEIPGLDRVPCLTSDTMLESPAIPDSIIILGGGAVALEAAHFYSALGVEVTVLQRSAHVLSEFDADVAIALQEALQGREVRILNTTSLLRVEMVGQKKHVIFNHENTVKSVEADEILYALGRKPALEGLQLERAGVAFAEGELKINAFQQTSLQHIYAAGDATGPFEIVHIAIEQGELAARNAARQVRGHREPLESMDYRLKSFVVFTSPQAASVGLSEMEATRANLPVRVARSRFDDHGKSLIMGETEGFVKLIAKADSGEIVGAASVGSEASELIHEIIVAMHFHATAADLARIPHYHPTLSEIWTYPAAELS